MRPEGLEVDRLDEVAFEAGLAGTRVVGFLAVTRDGNQGTPRSSGSWRNASTTS